MTGFGLAGRTRRAAWVCALTIVAAASATADQGTQGKSDRATAQAKLDTRLRAVIEREKTGDTGTSAPRSGAIDLDELKRALVDIEADVSRELRSAIEAAGGLVVSEFPAYHSVRARVPLTRLEGLAGRADVKFIRTAEQGITNSPSGSVR